MFEYEVIVINADFENDTKETFRGIISARDYPDAYDLLTDFYGQYRIHSIVLSDLETFVIPSDSVIFTNFAKEV